MKQKIHYLFMLLLMLLTGVGGVKAEEVITFTPGTDTGETSVTKENVTATMTTMNNASYYQIFANQSATFTCSFGKITKIEFTCTASGTTKYGPGNCSTNVGTYTFSEKKGTWTGSAESVTISSTAQVRMSSLTITYEKPQGPVDPIVSFADESFEVAKGKSAVNEISKPSDLTVSYESSDQGVASVNATTGEVTGVAIGEATVTAKWNAVVDKYNSGSKSYTVVVREPTTQELALLYESWSKSLAANDGTNELGVTSSNLDYNNWKEFSKVYQGGGQCGKLGTKDATGKMTTKEIALHGNGTLTFKIKKFGSDSGKLKVSATGATIVGDSQFSPTSADEWTDCTINLVNGNGEVTIVLETTSKRMYIDDIILLEVPTYTIDVVSNNTSYGSVSMENNVITATPAEGYRLATPAYTVTSGEAEVEQDENTFIVTAKSDCQVQIIFEAIPTYTVTFSVNGTETSKSFAEGSNITFDTPDDVQGKQFVGWTTAAIDGTTDECPKLVTLGTMGSADVTYYAVFANVTAGTATSTEDILTREWTGVKETTTYAEWSGKKASSDAIYAGQSAGDKNSIQLRSNNSNSGVVSTTSGGRLKKVVVAWNGETAADRTLNVYGSNTAYTAATDLYDESKQGTLLGTIVKGTSTELAINGDYTYVGLRSASGAMYLTSISITWENGTPDTYSNYCTTVVAPVKPAKPIVFHDGGEYEDALTVAMAGEGTIKYTLNGDEQTYTAPFTISETTTITAWTEQDGAKSDEVTREYIIVEKAKGAVVEDGYYTIQNKDGKYVNVAGRKTVTLVSDTKSAGTVIRVKADEDGVKVLRSQAVDLPRYAERAMNYVPEIVKEVVKKLAANVDDPIIGEQGADLILDKFKKEFDYHLYLEGENNTYRIYGRTPSMKPVVDFYAENKQLVDSRLLKVEDFVKEVLQKIVNKVGRGQSVVDMFKVKTIWQNMGGTLTEPTDDASTLKFYEEVLSSETNVWNFAYQTGMLYWEKVKGYLTENAGSLGDYGKYLEKIPNVRPNFKYYIVPGENGVDIISEGNSQITDASTAWTLTKREGFDVTFDATLSKNNGNEMYKTLYVDFAYELPKNVKALKVESVSDAGVAVTKEITGVVPAQTAVLLMSTDVENLTKTLLLSTTDGAAVANELKGNDWLINKYKINTPQLETIFALLTKLSSSLGEKYEYLKLKNSGTVNNKYFFGLSVPTKEGDFKEAFMNGKIKVLTNGERGLGFYSNCDKNLVGNEVFMFSEDFNPILLTLKGDVNRDGKVSVADVNALVEIVLGKVTETDDTHDFDAAHVNADKDITIADVTALVNIILGK